MGLEMTDKRVTNIADMGGTFMILADNEMFEARTVLLSTGIAAAKGMENEDRLLGAGVSYCATCDGFLYKGKTAAVYCTDERMEHDIKYLEEICGKLYIYTSFGYTTDAENAEVLKLPVKKLDGGMKCDSIELTDGTKIDVDGIFILRPAIAPSTVLPGLEMDGAHIKVGRSQETNFKGCYAAGDCTGRPYQIAKAVGEGNVAAHAILELLSEMQKKRQNRDGRTEDRKPGDDVRFSQPRGHRGQRRGGTRRDTEGHDKVRQGARSQDGGARAQSGRSC